MTKIVKVKNCHFFTDTVNENSPRKGTQMGSQYSISLVTNKYTAAEKQIKQNSGRNHRK